MDLQTEATAAPRQKWPWIFLLGLPMLVYALWPWPSMMESEQGLAYVLQWEPLRCLAFFLVFYGLYILPALLIFFWVGRTEAENRFLTTQRFLLSFAWGMVVHALAAFLQKYFGLSYSPWTVLACLGLAYLATAFAFRPLKFLLREEPQSKKWDFLVWPILILTLVLGAELTLRARVSSLSLMGDAYGHLILLLATQADGPLPNGLPFYSTFILNLYPMGFHALLANLFALLPGIEHIDLFRYFSLVFLPTFVFVFFGFFSFLAGSRLLGSIGTLALLSVSGGGLTLRVPIVYFPWYWALAWCLSAAIFYLLLKGDLKSKTLYFWAGVTLGVGVLMHPMMAPRMGTILLFFLPLELLRRLFTRQALRPLLTSGACFALGTILLLGAWLGPLVLRFGLEETYSYAYILEHFSKLAPKAVKYIRDLHELTFGFQDLLPWIQKNAGIFPMVLAPLGLVAALFQWKKPAAPLLLAWTAAMLSAVLLAYLPNPYRYFEYLFLGMVALSVFGMAWLSGLLAEKWRPILFCAFLLLALGGVRRDFWPKYGLALELYGRTDWPANYSARTRNIVRSYQRAKANGTLDEEYGEFRGFLWPRQKKVWDIYLERQQRNLPKR